LICVDYWNATYLNVLYIREQSKFTFSKTASEKEKWKNTFENHFCFERRKKCLTNCWTNQTKLKEKKTFYQFEVIWIVYSNARSIKISDRKLSVSAEISVSVSVLFNVSVSAKFTVQIRTENRNIYFKAFLGSVSVSVSNLVLVQTEPKFWYFGFGLNSGFGRSLIKMTDIQKSNTVDAA
jgi:hypothetical protein